MLTMREHFIIFFVEHQARVKIMNQSAYDAEFNITPIIDG